MSTLFAFDITRLFLGPLSAMPRGIDRVDIAVARHLFSPGTCYDAVGILPTPWGIRAFSADRVRRGLHKLEDLWAEKITAEDDPVWTNLRQRMLASGSTEASPSLAKGRSHLSLGQKLARIWQVLNETGVGFGRPVRSLPHGTPYLNVGQIGLAAPAFFHWLSDRPDIAAIFMLHDVIPIQHPHMVANASVRDHARMVKTAARFADALVVTTKDAAASISDELRQHSDRDFPTLARWLPLSNGFTYGTVAHQDLIGHDYFVVCGTVEPRKNHALLIDVWQKLIERDGNSAPHLVMVGTPGWSAEKLFTTLSGRPLLRSHVHHASGVSTPALAQIIAGSRALLAPSFAEGFNLPLLEARALDVPVIASDIAVHRERADDGTCLVGTSDTMGWLAAIDAVPEAGQRAPRLIDSSLREASYCEDILQFVRNCQQAKHARVSPGALPPSNKTTLSPPTLTP